MTSVKVVGDGLSLRFGQADTPAPEGVLQSRSPPRIVVAVSPPDPRTRVAVEVHHSNGTSHNFGLRAEQRTLGEQYFAGAFPRSRPGERTRYSVVASLTRQGKTFSL